MINAKYFVLVFVFIFSVPVWSLSAPILTERVPVASDSNLFFPVINKTMILRGLEPDDSLFGNLEKSGKDIDRIRKIPISFLAPFGLKEGMNIQFIEKDGEKHSFKLNKMVNVILIHKDPMDENVKIQPYWSRFNLVLTDDLTQLRVLANEKEDFEVPNGIAYVGTLKTLQSTKPEKFPVSKIKVNDPIYSIQFSSFSKSGESIRTVEVLNNIFFFQPFKSEVDSGNYLTTAIKTKAGKYFVITPNNDLLTEKHDFLILDSWIKGFKTKLYKDPYNDDSCLELLLISSNTVEEVQMKCKLTKD